MSFKTKWTRLSIPHEEWWGVPGNVFPDDPPRSLTDAETLTYSNDLLLSQGNPHGDLGHTSLDRGGPFRVKRRFYEEHNTVSGSSPAHFSATADPTSPGGDHFHGVLRARFGSVVNDNFPGVLSSSRELLRALGVTAIARCLPTNPLADLATMLGEAREGLPALNVVQGLEKRADICRTAGSGYLNEDFGWRPLLSDIAKINNAIRKWDEVLDAYHANSGKRIKARYAFPTTLVESDKEQTDGRTSPSLTHLDIWDQSEGSRLTYRLSKTERWFEGAFMYHLPENTRGNSYNKRASDLNKMLGTRITPETLWNLAPWSWMADWFLNTGDVIHNIVAFQNDGLVMQYGYMMERKTVIDTYELTGIRFRSYPGDHHFRQVLTSVVKAREPASPYGFGVTFDSLNDRQKATIIALGLSRA